MGSAGSPYSAVSSGVQNDLSIVRSQSNMPTPPACCACARRLEFSHLPHYAVTYGDCSRANDHQWFSRSRIWRRYSERRRDAFGDQLHAQRQPCSTVRRRHRQFCGESSATLTVESSTLTGNLADDYGGGIANLVSGPNNATLTINNSTLSANTGLAGGGIVNLSGGGSALVTVSNTTFSGNVAEFGGGIGNARTSFGAAIVDIGNTIFKSGASGENILNNSGSVISRGYSLSDDDAGGFLTGPGDQINTDPLLGPLQDNGGPTFTHALLPSSPAIDAGDPNFTPTSAARALIA